MQPVAAAPVDAELWWTVYIRGALVDRDETYAQGVFVGNKVPPSRKPRMVIVRRDGGTVNGLFDRPRVSFNVWGDKDKATGEKEAGDLARLVLALAQVAPLSGAGVTHVEVQSGPNAIPDESGAPRFLCLIEATHRAVVLT